MPLPDPVAQRVEKVHLNPARNHAVFFCTLSLISMSRRTLSHKAEK
jgi:hypothetical protein